MDNAPGMITLHSDPPQFNTARLLAVEVLLANPERLADDVLESCLYILRERLLNANGEGGDRAGDPAGEQGRE